MDRPTIAFDADKLESLKAAYKAAVVKRETQFVWTEMQGTGRFARKVKDHDLLTSYAKYLIEHLDEIFAANPTPPKRPNLEGEEGQ